MERRLATIEVRRGMHMESQSGLQMLHPKIFGAYEAPDHRPEIAAILVHPVSNFFGHYLISPLAQRGICCMGLNTRYVGNDSTLIMERAILDLGAGVQFMREQGYKKIVLIGNSGGAALVAFYQAEAENPRVLCAPHSDVPVLGPGDLDPADAIVLCGAHTGRASILREWLDGAVTDERDPSKTDPDLDIYAERTVPFTKDFLQAYRSAQVKRRDRIEAWVRDRLDVLTHHRGRGADEAFVIHRTHADPRFVDLSLDANDRKVGSIWGDARLVNYSSNSVGRYTTLTSFLSQWSSVSQAEGPPNLAKTTVPVQLIEYTADSSTFPSTAAAWKSAVPSRIEHIKITGADHYLSGRPDLVDRVADEIAKWCREHL
jgi:pimeloyl-ACP methyl ester carboxylesterase